MRCIHCTRPSLDGKYGKANLDGNIVGLGRCRRLSLPGRNNVRRPKGCRSHRGRHVHRSGEGAAARCRRVQSLGQTLTRVRGNKLRPDNERFGEIGHGPFDVAQFAARIAAEAHRKWKLPIETYRFVKIIGDPSGRR